MVAAIEPLESDQKFRMAPSAWRRCRHRRRCRCRRCRRPGTVWQVQLRALASSMASFRRPAKCTAASCWRISTFRCSSDYSRWLSRLVSAASRRWRRFLGSGRVAWSRGHGQAQQNLRQARQRSAYHQFQLWEVDGREQQATQRLQISRRHWQVGHYLIYLAEEQPGQRRQDGWVSSISVLGSFLTLIRLLLQVNVASAQSSACNRSLLRQQGPAAMIPLALKAPLMGSLSKVVSLPLHSPSRASSSSRVLLRAQGWLGLSEWALEEWLKSHSHHCLCSMLGPLASTTTCQPIVTQLREGQEPSGEGADLGEAAMPGNVIDTGFHIVEDAV